MDWFRWYHGTFTDPKFRVISRRSGVPLASVLAIWAAMLETASAANKRGTLEGWDHEDIAAALDMDTEPVEAVYQAMQGKTLDGDSIRGWDRRQRKREDQGDERTGAMSAAERKRLQRGREKAKREASEIDKVTRGHDESLNVTHGHDESRQIREEETREEQRSRSAQSQTSRTGAHVSTAQSASPPTSTEAGLMAKELRARCVDVTPSNPVLLSWIDEGITVEHALACADICRERKPGERIPARYLDKVIRGQLKQVPTSTGPPRQSHQQVLEESNRRAIEEAKRIRGQSNEKPIDGSLVDE